MIPRASRILFLLFVLIAAGMAHAAPFAYITNQSSQDVAVIDLATNTVVARIPIPVPDGFGGVSPFGVAVNAAGTRLYVVGANTDRVHVIDTTSHAIVSSIIVTGAEAVAVNPAGTRIYVTRGFADRVDVFDTADNSLVASLVVGDSPNSVLVNAAGDRVYVTNRGTPDTVRVIDATTNTLVGSAIPVGDNPQRAAFNLAATHLWVTSQTANTVSIIDLSTNTVTTTLSGFLGPNGVAFTADGTRVYVVNVNNHTVSVLDASTNSVLSTISLGSGFPQGVQISSDGTRAYVIKPNAGVVAVIDTSSDTVLTNVTVGSSPIAYGRFIGGPAAIPPPTITNAPPPNGTLNAGYSFTYTSNWVSTFSVTSGSLPPGLTLNATTGVLNGTPSATGTSSGVVTATNGNAPDATQAFSITIHVAPFAYITNRTSNDVSVFDTAGFSVIATVPVGSAPIGVGVNAAGTRAYVANSGSNDVSVINTATNTVIGTAVAVGTSPFGIAVNPTAARAYVANGGSNDVTVFDTTTNTTIPPTVPVGTSPRGVAFNPSGTRAYVANFGSDDVTVIDTTTNTVVTTVAVGDGPTGVAVTPDGTRVYVGNTNSNNVSVIDTGANTVLTTVAAVGIGPYGVAVNPAGTRVYVADGGNNKVNVIDTATNTLLPAIPVSNPLRGIAVNAAGTHLYVANQGGSNRIQVVNIATSNVSNSIVGTDPEAFGLFLAVVPPAPPAPTITNGPPPNGTVGVAYSFTYTSTNSPTFSATGTLPTGLSLSPAGVISGTPTAAGTFAGITVTATNGTAPDATQSFGITIAPAPPTITNGPPPNGTVGVAYSFTYTSTNSPTFSATGTLPTGLSLSSAGVISGTPTAAGTFAGITVTATNGTAPDATQNISITIAPPAPTITNGPPPNGTVGVAYSFTYMSTNSPTFSATGTLPTGLTLSPAGVISGTPTAAGTFAGITVTATNGTAPDATQSFGITIAPAPPTITNGPPPNGTVGVAYSFTYTSTNSPTFSATGTLPNGLTLSPAGVISGLPTAAGSFAGITVTATNGTAPDATQSFSMTIAASPPPAPTITNGPPPNGTAGVAYSFTYTATSSPTFSTTGTLPNGLTLSPAGVISGTPTTAGTFAGITVTATNGTAPDATQSFGMTIAPAAPTITNGPPPDGTIGIPYSFMYTSTNSPSFSAIGALPTGLTLSPAGLISGTPSSAGSFGGTVTATNGTAPDATQNFNITIGLATTADLAIVKTGPSSAELGSTFQYTLTITNNGPGSATNVTITDPTPNRLQFVSNSGACSTPFPCNIGTLTNGQIATITAKYKVQSGGSTSNTASVTSDSADPAPSNNTSTKGTTLTCPTGGLLGISPPDGTTNQPTTGALTWLFAGTSTSYDVYLGPAGSGCSTRLLSTTTRSVSYGGLTQGTDYEWRVEARASGCPIRTSACFKFRTATACDATAPIPVNPAGGTTQSSPIEFVWTPSNGATEYVVFASIGNAAAVEIGRTSATSLIATLADGLIRWHVVASVPNCGPLQSATREFSVCNIAIPTPRIAGEISSGQTYRVDWDALPNALRYEVDESDNATFTSAQTFSTQATTIPFTHQTTVAKAFYYRVRAFSACSPTIGPSSTTIRVVIVPLPSRGQKSPSVNVPAGSTEVIVQEVFIPGEAGQTLSFSASVDRPWLSVTPLNGVLPAEGMTLRVVADPALLPNGTFTGTVIVVITTPAVSTIASHGTTPVAIPISVNLVTPVSPVASVQTPTSNALIIPSIGHLSGINSQWQSDIRVANTSAQAQKYSLKFTPSNPADGIKQTTITIEAAATTALDDIVKNWYGIGSLGDAALGMLEIRPTTTSGLPNTSLTTVVSSRTYNVASNGTLGQFIPAIPFASFIGKAIQGGQTPVLSLQQISQNSAYRTNVGLLEASGVPASVMVSVLSNSGQKLLELPFLLAGGQQMQLNGLLSQNNLSLDDGRIEVRVVGGDGKVSAYASTVDNQTGDPLLVSPVQLGFALASKWVLLGVADLETGIANWQTDMRVFNSGVTPQTATLTFVPLFGGLTSTASVTIAGGEVKSFDNAVQSLFTRSNVGGAVHVTTPSGSSLVVSGRTFNQTGAGTFGQFIPAVTPTEAASLGGKVLNILQVEDSVRFRTNLGVAELTGKPATVEVQVILPDSKFTPTVRIPLAANEYRQFAILRELGMGNIYNARLSIRVVDGDGRVTAYGSIIDETTQDPTYITAQ